MCETTFRQIIEIGNGLQQKLNQQKEYKTMGISYSLNLF